MPVCCSHLIVAAVRLSQHTWAAGGCTYRVSLFLHDQALMMAFRGSFDPAPHLMWERDIGDAPGFAGLEAVQPRGGAGPCPILDALQGLSPAGTAV
jgi:hypothetical protein